MSVAGSGVELLRYVYRPEALREAPTPYIHPLRTLSGQNLWGGNTYVHGEGYLALP